MPFNFNKFSNREQILIFGLIILLFISALIFVICGQSMQSVFRDPFLSVGLVLYPVSDSH